MNFCCSASSDINLYKYLFSIRFACYGFFRGDDLQ